MSAPAADKRRFPFTHVVDLVEGSGFYEDFRSRDDAMAAHRAAVEGEGALSSRVIEYDGAGELIGVVVEWESAQ